MKQRLPSLNALRAFDAVATRLSFTRAAKDLNVTPGAVRYLVNELEQDLGVKLLDRRNRKLALTNAAQAGVPTMPPQSSRTTATCWWPTARVPTTIVHRMAW